MGAILRRFLRRAWARSYWDWRSIQSFAFVFGKASASLSATSGEMPRRPLRIMERLARVMPRCLASALTVMSLYIHSRRIPPG
jgi:hypothetical protein